MHSIEAKLRKEDVRRVQTRLNLPPRAAVIFCLLATRGFLMFEAMRDALYEGSAEWPEDVVGAVRTHVRRLRWAVSTHGVKILSVYGTGYRLDEASQAKAKELMRAAQ